MKNFFNSLALYGLFVMVLCWCLPVKARPADYVDGKTLVQYYAPDRVALSTDGTLGICPYEIAYPLYAKNTCVNRQTPDDAKSGWIYLREYNPGGYYLHHLQINTTSEGPALVLFWYPTDTVLANEKKKHP